MASHVKKRRIPRAPKPMMDDDDAPRKMREHVRVLKAPSGTNYEEDHRLPTKHAEAFNIRTIGGLVDYLDKNPKVGLEARVLGLAKGEVRSKKYSSAGFREAFKSTPPASKISPRKFREADAFSTDGGYGSNFAGADIYGGGDFVPLLGGPFYKQQYYYDYIKAHMTAFQAYNHDPCGRAIINIMVEFTLGRGFRVDAKGKQSAMAQILWDAFVRVNALPELLQLCARELSMYGETMWWRLPGKETKIVQAISPGDPDNVPRGIIPRVRLIDPSCIWDIITYPEDITRKIAYQWVAPTQYQVFTKADKGIDGGAGQQSLKFIYQQIPAKEVAHYKVNVVSNEKRGRSDLYPVLGYLKRLRDAVNYSVIQMQKQAAWAIDTAIDGSQDDIDAYVSSQQQMGTIPNAGSEFVHSKAVEREMLSSAGSGAGQNIAFEWCLSMIAIGTGIPVSYLGTHLTGTASKASAMVSTEPVVKKFEIRRGIYVEMLTDMFAWVMKENGIDASCEVTFPEIVVQDRAEKLTSLQLAVTAGWISNERAATIASKEFDITDFDFIKEKEKIDSESAAKPSLVNPLSTPPKFPQKPDGNPSDEKSEDASLAKRDGISQDERRRVRQNRG